MSNSAIPTDLFEQAFNLGYGAYDCGAGWPLQCELSVEFFATEAVQQASRDNSLIRSAWDDGRALARRQANERVTACLAACSDKSRRYKAHLAWIAASALSD